MSHLRIFAIPVSMRDATKTKNIQLNLGKRFVPHEMACDPHEWAPYKWVSLEEISPPYKWSYTPVN